MTRRLLLLSLILLFTGAAAFVLWPTGEQAPGEDSLTPATTGELAAAPRREAAMTPVAGKPDAARVEAAPSDAPPLPPDVKWCEIRVVVAATGAPAPDADVAWIDTSIYQRIELPDRQKQELFRDPERMARRFGWHARSDAQGRLRINLGDGTSLYGRLGDLYGTLQCSRDVAPPPGGYVLELVPDNTLVVQVLDAEGAPAPGVPIAVGQYAAGGRFLHFVNWGELTSSGADGLARIPHLQDWHIDPTEQPPTVEWRARLFVPGCAEAGVAFDPRSPPVDPLVLRLPACGVVAARVEMRGAPLRGEDRGAVNLLAKESNPDAGEVSWWQQLDDGRATFGFVPLGIDFTLSGYVDSTELQREFRGPTRPHEQVQVVLTIGDDEVVVTGRALDEQRRLIVNQQLSVRCEADGFYGGGEMRTDDHGRFQFCLGASKDKVAVHGVSVEWNRQDAPSLRGSAAVQELVPGVQDIGDVVLGPGPLVVSGRCMQGAKPYTGPLHIVVQRYAPEEAEQSMDNWGDPDWSEPMGLALSQGRDGSFAVHGEAPAGRYRLMFPAWNHLPIAPIEFALGTVDLVVQVSEGAGLTATLLLPDGVTSALLLRLVPEGAGPGAPAEPDRLGGAFARFDRFETTVWQNEDKRSLAQWRALPPGSYRLEARLFAQPALLLAIEHIVVPPPEGGDPRLADIDLRDKIEVLTLEFQDRSGAPVTGAQGIAVPLPQAAAVWQVLEVECPVAKLAFPPGGVDLMLAVQGFRPQQLRAARGSLEVTLESWPQVELQFAELPELPKNTYLEVMVRGEEPGEAHELAGQWMRGSQADFTEPLSDSFRVEKGRVVVRVGDGPQQLGVQLVYFEEGKDSYRTAPVAGVSPTQFYAGPAPVTVRVDAAALQRAIEELAKAK